MSAKQLHRCGDSGGRTANGKPCRFKVAEKGARCSRHNPEWAGPDPAPVDPRDKIGRPRDWDKAVLAAYFRLIGSTIAEAAKQAGTSETSLGVWESCSWWPAACRQATEDKWLSHLLSRSMRTIFRDVSEDSRLALQVTERLLPKLAPPKVRSENTNLDIDPEDLTEEELVRIGSGESPLKVLSETRAARVESDGDDE